MKEVVKYEKKKNASRVYTDWAYGCSCYFRAFSYFYWSKNYPTTDQGLLALVEKPELEPVPNNWSPGGYLSTSTVPKDPWGNDYIYRSPTEDENRDYEIISFGADGQEGGENYNADIASYTIGQ